MYSSPAQASVPRMVDTLERTATPIASGPRLGLIYDAGSRANSRYRDCQNVFDVLKSDVAKLLETPPNWNSYDSPAPTRNAVKNAQNVLDALRAKLVAPERALPSAEGGISFIFVSDTISRAVIESFNTGDSMVLLYDLNGNSDTIDWPGTLDAQMHLVDRIRDHLRSNGLASQGN